jgi:UDP-N-acetylmuramyl pentapeptide synthase
MPDLFHNKQPSATPRAAGAQSHAGCRQGPAHFARAATAAAAAAAAAGLHADDDEVQTRLASSSSKPSRMLLGQCHTVCLLLLLLSLMCDSV